MSDNIKNYDVFVENVADLAHEKFREIYSRDNNGSRMKTTKDEAWIKKHGTDQSDLAKLRYYDVPTDWQKERWYGAKEAVDALLAAVAAGKPLDKDFVEQASEIVHKEWLKRNCDRAREECKLAYADLSEQMKEKDRIFVDAAIEEYGKQRSGQYEPRDVSVILLYDKEGKILLQHRSADAKRSPNCWAFFGGGIEAGETPEQAVRRESLEELSYVLDNPRLVLEQRFSWGGFESCKYVFTEEYDVSKELILGEGQGMDWNNYAELEKLGLSDHDMEALELIKDHIFKK
ncbi:NUDIX domain-containing protein [Candidatus Falkowbacteria bacterium]|nr:NUDIX domain-containing protein [Candidatus Falkowbacteria bacterium]